MIAGETREFLELQFSSETGKILAVSATIGRQVHQVCF
jgi:hypothetical protein